MVAAKSAWNSACQLQKTTTTTTTKQTNDVIVNFMRNYNLPGSLVLSNSDPVLAWHYIFRHLATSLSMLDHCGRDSPIFDLKVTVILIAQMGS